jgi:predicted nucleotidyltransferase
MRLSARDRETIRTTVAELFGSGVTVRVFGSRIDPTARGGDIDLLVESAEPIAEPARRALQLVALLQLRLGDQPIDVLVLGPDTPRRAIHDEALRTGVAL